MGLAGLGLAASFGTTPFALRSVYGLFNGSSLFAYRPLDESGHQIRLIKILPQDQLNDNINGPLKATIKHVFLRDKPSYLALSYVWGDPRKTKTLMLDGQTLQITESLNQALQHLAAVDDYPLPIPDSLIRDMRRPKSSDTNMLHIRDYIWVDAICINQQDDDEKSCQVQLMREIFHEANTVIIWLGPAADGSDTVIKCFQKVGKGMHNSTALGELVKPAYLEIQKSIEFPLASMKAFCERPWWQRV